MVLRRRQSCFLTPRSALPQARAADFAADFVVKMAGKTMKQQMDGWSYFGWLIPISFDWTHLETKHILVGWSEVWELAADLSKLQRSRRHHDRKWIWGMIHQHPLRWGRWTSTYYLGVGWCRDFDPSIPNSSNTLTKSGWVRSFILVVYNSTMPKNWNIMNITFG